MKTLLYVDDSQDERLLIRNACRLAKVSFGLKTAANGEVASRYLSGESEFGDRVEYPLPDLILLDLKMHEMDGFQLIRWIRSQTEIRTIPLVLFSGSPIPSDIARGYGEGASYFIIKPTSLKKVMDILRAMDQCLRSDWADCRALEQFSEPRPKQS